jgi:TatD DNase family protein
MLLTDTHCHLDFRDYEKDRTFVLSRAWDAGVERILVPGIDLQTSKAAVELADKNPQIFAAVGTHPNSANKWDYHTLGLLDEMTEHPKVVAVGEIGLDYYRDWTPHPLQIRVFREQLDMAAQRNLPVVIHTRNTKYDDLSCMTTALNILTEYPVRGVLHSFSGNIELAKRALDLGLYIGITGPVTFKKAVELREVVAAVPLDSLLIETDSPFLTPFPNRGKRNEPAFVRFIAQKIAEIHNKPPDVIAEITSENARRLFQWSD